MKIGSRNPVRAIGRIFSHCRSIAIGGDCNTEKKDMDWRPLENIAESKKEYLLKTAMPDIRYEDLQVSENHGRLTISGRRKMKEEGDELSRHRVKSSCGRFWRSFAIPDDVDKKGITAETMNGVIKVHLPKTRVEMPGVSQLSVH